MDQAIGSMAVRLAFGQSTVECASDAAHQCACTRIGLSASEPRLVPLEGIETDRSAP